MAGLQVHMTEPARLASEAAAEPATPSGLWPLHSNHSVIHAASGHRLEPARNQILCSRRFPGNSLHDGARRTRCKKSSAAPARRKACDSKDRRPCRSSLPLSEVERISADLNQITAL